MKIVFVLQDFKKAMLTMYKLISDFVSVHVYIK